MTLKKIINYLILGLVFLLPLFLLPLMVDFYSLPKNFLLIFAGVTLFCLWFAESILSNKFKFGTSPFDLPVLLFCVATIISTFIASPNKIESLLAPGGTGTIIALTLLYFVIKNANLTFQRPIGHPNVRSNKVINALLTSAGLLSLLSFYQFLGIGEEMAPFEWMKAKFWTPAGSLLALAVFLVVGLVMAVMRFKRKKVAVHLGETHSSDTGSKEVHDPVSSLVSQEGSVKNSVEEKPLSATSRFLSLATIVLLLLGLATTLYQLFTTQKPALLPYSSGWSIAVEGFKNLKTGLFGVGPGNFITAFTRFKPIGINNTEVWNARFTYSSNFYLQLLTEVGLLGLLSFLFIAYKILTQKSSIITNHYALITILILSLLLPSNLILLLAFFVLLGLEAGSYKKEYYPQKAKVWPEQVDKVLKSKVLVAIPVLLELVFLFFFGQAVYAEVLYKKALDQAAQGRGGDTYNLLIEAIKKNPYRDNFRVSYSQINLALANNWATKEEVTDKDRATITQLVQQAIREAKAAVSLNPLKVSNWENLAVIYRNLINIAQGADQWAVVSYNQAISLDPFNPILRTDLGGVFYAYGNYNQAERIFEQAVNIKPDWANGRYNLAAALREKGEYAQAAQQMQTTLSLVEPESNDFKKASSELEELRKKISTEVPAATPSGELETLSPPAEVPEGIEPPLELEEEAKPEITPTIPASPTPTTGWMITPEVSPTVTSGASPTPRTSPTP